MKKIFTNQSSNGWGRYAFLIMFFLYSSWAMAQQTITGIISDGTGQPVPGATVLIKGTTTGVAAGTDGKYTIKATAKQVLVFKSVGYETKEVTVGSSTTVNVTLANTATNLSEVVLIGYGTQKRTNTSGAVSTLKNDNFDERAITRVDQALVGQLSGVTVKQTSGIPGKAFSIQIRGSGSISAGNEPLYVIDGFPLTNNSSNTASGNFANGNPLDNLNPNDIENIEILKDAAAASIYGSRGSNGVVLITTKHGKAGAPRLSLNAYTGFNEASKYLPMLNDQQFIARATEYINTNYVNTFASKGALTTDDAATRQAKIGGLSGSQVNNQYMLDPRWAIPGHPGLTYIDMQKATQRKGAMQNVELSANGGTDAVKYFISGDLANQESFMIGVSYKNYSARANVEVNASKNLKLGVNIAPSYSISQDPGVDGKDAIYQQSLYTTPLQEDSVGLYPQYGKNNAYTWGQTNVVSPLARLQNVVGQTKRYRTLSTVYAEYQVINGLSFKSTLNLDNTDNNFNRYSPYTVSGGAASARVFNGTNNLTALSSGSYSSFRRQTFVNQNYLTYNTAFKGGHSLTVLLGQEYNVDRVDNVSLSSATGFSNAVIQTLNQAPASTGNTQSTKSVLQSYISRVQYDYKEKYLLLASLRYDGSSRFGTNNQYAIFPAASVAWRLSQEEFMKKVPVISDLKLRFSYGTSGNNNIGDYPSIPLVSSGNQYTFGGAAVTGVVPSNLANPNLKWERNTTYNYGIDFGVLNNRITGSIEAYSKLTDQLLLNVQIPEATGFQTYLANSGSLKNIGQELELTSRNTVGKFQWGTTVVIAHNTNKILALASGQTQIIIPNGFDQTDQILRVGEALNSIYVLKYNGFLTAADIANKVPTYGPAGAEQPGDPKFEDANHDGVITEADKQIVAHPSPDYTFGVTNTFRYKAFDLSVLIQGQHGGSIYSDLGRAITRPGQGYADNTPVSFAERWISPANQGAGRFGKTFSTYNSPITATTDWLYSSDYIRVKDITVGYNLKTVIKKGFQSARIYLSVENFFGADKYTNGLNPEASNTSAGSNSAYPQAVDYGGLPLPKSLIFGVNFTF
ncbi:MAG: TonB-dependent receptor [Bacteroidota bacterium]